MLGLKGTKGPEIINQVIVKCCEVGYYAEFLSFKVSVSQLISLYPLFLSKS